GVSRKILFVDAADDALVRRFESTRRPHPLQGAERILDGIGKERERLREVRDSADIVIDSSALNIHQLEKKINDYFHEESESDLRVNILSFGYKYGIPVDADLVMDCRFIANPHWIPELRPLTGKDKAVSDEVLTLAIGCTGGKHRSVAITEELVSKLSKGKDLSKYRIETHAIHRDLGREI
ncbi:MAG: RNase adaptor protein RapZ, partial [Actinobacteria bacterium]|nr:RNase adaptor protein RapZ [Actinomycetota bacterium]